MVGAGAQEGRAAAQGPISAGQGGQLPLDFQLGHRLRQVQRRVAKLGGNVLEQLVDRSKAEGSQHFGLFLLGAGDVMGLEMSGGGHAIVSFSL